MFGSFVDKRPTIVINYKSGRQVRVKAKQFTVTREGSEITAIETTDITPRYLFIGLDDIESIWNE